MSLTALLLNRQLPPLPKGTPRAIDADMRFRAQCKAAASAGRPESQRRNAQTRASNTEKVLSAIAGGAHRYNEIIAETGLSKSTVTGICNDLLDAFPPRLVRTIGHKNSTIFKIGGQP